MATPIKFKNNALGHLASSISSGTTTITLVSNTMVLAAGITFQQLLGQNIFMLRY